MGLVHDAIIVASHTKYEQRLLHESFREERNRFGWPSFGC